MKCARCEKELSYNELGLNKKYNAGGNALCMSCLAEKLEVTEQRLNEKIEEFLRVGCLLFVKTE